VSPTLIVLALAAWLLASIAFTFPLAHLMGASRRSRAPRPVEPETAPSVPVPAPPPLTGETRCVLVVDDNPGFRALLRTSFESVNIEVEEADSAHTAAGKIAAAYPDVVVLDVAMPGLDGLAFCDLLKTDPRTSGIKVVLLTGAEHGTEEAARGVGADGFLRKPFSPLALLRLIDRISGDSAPAALMTQPQAPAGTDQLMLYAQDLRHLLELERAQRTLLQNAYRETATALSRALESKDTGTGVHSQRVQRYAAELCDEIGLDLGAHPSIEYGFLLHDLGKIGIPDYILQKAGSLTDSERRRLQTHTLIGEQMLEDVVLLRGEGLEVVRSHHERWDGCGYPDHLARDEIPLAARVFTIADTLDAITSDRPYRTAGTWAGATAEIVDQAGKQFDPDLVQAFCETEPRLRELHRELSSRLDAALTAHR
jgi:ribonuclease P protein subunit RPR2